MNGIQKMYCPSCGAPIVFEEGREDTFCSHCGCQLHRDDENVVRRMAHIERKLEHEEKVMEYADRHEEREYSGKKLKQDMMTAVFLCVGGLLFTAALLLMMRWFFGLL